MANFRESIDALKEARLTDSEILEIMSESVDGQMLTKNLQKIKESDHELPDKINTKTPSTCKRKSCVLRAEKHIKSIRQDSPRHNLKRERTSVLISLPTEQPFLCSSVPTNSAFQPIWMKPPI